MINDLPTVYEVVSDRKQAKEKSGVDSGSKSKPSTKVGSFLNASSVFFILLTKSLFSSSSAIK